ncbi:unnamed protein product [Ilex paraguariensis]|uniref:Uncharacterized protein n=1 Tax=Ilex paraguariensis TaxID=185542 RepID=A0ABC8UI13_9AQUA
MPYCLSVSVLSSSPLPSLRPSRQPPPFLFSRVLVILGLGIESVHQWQGEVRFPSYLEILEGFYLLTIRIRIWIPHFCWHNVSISCIKPPFTPRSCFQRRCW